MRSPHASSLLLSLLLFLGWSTLAFVLAPATPSPGRAMPAAERVTRRALSRGVNITGWFRLSSEPRTEAVLRAWLSDAALTSLRRAGFTFVRLAVDPDVVASTELRDVLVQQIRRLQRHGLAVVVSPHPVAWRVDADPGDQARLIGFLA